MHCNLSMLRYLRNGYHYNSTFSIYYDAFDDGSNYFEKIITENTALQ